MKKLSLAVLVSTALLASQFTQAKMMSAIGSADGVTMVNNLRADNVEELETCYGVYCPPVGDDSTIQAITSDMGMTNSTITDAIDMEAKPYDPVKLNENNCNQSNHSIINQSSHDGVSIKNSTISNNASCNNIHNSSICVGISCQD